MVASEFLARAGHMCAALRALLSITQPETM